MRSIARRGAGPTSVYVPGTVEPMLPHALSSEACSLMPDVDRLAVTVELEIEGGRVRRSAFYRSLVRSDARLDYDGVDRIFAGEDQARDPWAQPLASARAAAAAVAGVRERAGALKVESEEPQFSFDERGEPVAIEPREQTESHRLIENLMIAANEAVAARLAAARDAVPVPRPRAPGAGAGRAARGPAGLAGGADAAGPGTDVPVAGGRARGRDLPRRRALHTQRRARSDRPRLAACCVRSSRPTTRPRNIGHAGLHTATYCHFTSPIRRYPDIVCHRSLLSTLGEREQAPRASELGELGEWTSEREREAATIERDADDVARCFLLERLLRARG